MCSFGTTLARGLQNLGFEDSIGGEYVVMTFHSFLALRLKLTFQTLSAKIDEGIT